MTDHKPSLFDKLRPAWGGVLLSLGLGWLCLTMDPMAAWFRALSYDLPFALQFDRKPDQEVRIVAMDEESYRQLGQSPTNDWNRSLHARLLENALKLGARAVVFDVLFDQPWSDPEVDRHFAEIMTRAEGRVALVTVLQETLVGDSLITTPFKPIPIFEQAAASGVANVFLETDRTVRRHYTNANYVPLAWRTAELVGQAPTHALAPRWINYYGPRGTIPSVSYLRILDATNALPPGYFDGMVLFVGRNPILVAEGTDNSDERRTPYTRWTGLTSTGVEIQATAYLNLVREDWLEELSFSSQFLLLLLTGLGMGLGLGSLRPWIAVWVGLAGFLLVAGVACYLAWVRHDWFPWVIINAVQIPAALGWSMITHTKSLAAEKASLHRQLEERPSATGLSSQGAGSVAASAPDASESSRFPAIPDHTVLRCVGRGAYGEVWLARDILGNFRAVKVIYRATFPEPEPFEREFRGMQNFVPISRRHPGWVDILHVGRSAAGDYFYYIMEAGDDERTGTEIDPEHYTPKTLAGELDRRKRLPLDECVDLSLALAEALEHLHQQSLVHRDVKPSNVIYVRGQPRFADIGSVTSIAEGKDVSRIGTEGYLAPEGPGSPAADVYSLGKVMYEMGLGRDRRAFPEMPTMMFEIPMTDALHAYHRIVLRACDADLSRRYASAAALQADLLALRERLRAGGT